MYLSHYNKEAVLSSIKVAQEHQKLLQAELTYWELKENPDWKPAPTLEEKVATKLFSFFQNQDSQDLNDKFSDFSADGIPGTEEYETTVKELMTECKRLAKQILS